MPLKIDQSKITKEVGEALVAACPFGAISYDGTLKIGAGCKMCKLCTKRGPAGAVTFEEEAPAAVCDKSKWRGVCVYAEQHDGKIHPVVFELIGKAKELAAVTGHEVYALLIGADVQAAAEELLTYGVDKVFVYDAPALENFVIGPYANAFTDFIEKIRPSSILVGATVLGRSLAPKVAARVRAGLTADCTVLKMKENTDLVQIRPAFGGNIMAQIVTPNTRPQFCTVRYKIFSAPEKCAPHGVILPMATPDKMLRGRSEVLRVEKKPEEVDISDADVIVAVGLGFAAKDDVALAARLAHALGAQLACTRPLVEAGVFDPKHQIGLSGRTVKPKLIITIGISGSVQFAAGMRSSDTIVAINSDPNASIFDVAHYGFIGDAHEIIPKLIEKTEGRKHV